MKTEEYIPENGIVVNAAIADEFGSKDPDKLLLVNKHLGVGHKLEKFLIRELLRDKHDAVIAEAEKLELEEKKDLIKNKS